MTACYPVITSRRKGKFQLGYHEARPCPPGRLPDPNTDTFQASSPTMSMWTIQTCEQSETGPLTFRLSAGAVKTVGRANRADIVLDAALVSRFHCRLSVTPTDTLEVEDLQSTNGTWVNDERVGRLQLAAGDRLRVGRVELKVERA
jgi:pSer/pThr/pTyr-binding forkhead associated (FHA) protein